MRVEPGGPGTGAVELSPSRRVYVSNGKVTIRCGSGGMPDAWGALVAI